MQLHPNTPALYVLAAQHELEHGGANHAAARALLQRGLRLNADSAELWAEYVRMELSFVEAVRRRWSVLGISVVSDNDDKRDEEAAAAEEEKGMDVDDDGKEEADAARREILEGGIVKSVITNAVEGAFIPVWVVFFFCGTICS
jgi:U3 small nucleolar RNA-associated protein 6